MNEIYFKQMPSYSPEFMSECIEMFSFDRIAHTVNQSIIDTLTGQGWTLAAAVEFIRSKAMRHGLDQTLGELLEKAAQDWLKIEASGYRADCHKWAEEAAR
jgi:hypothetical protein